MKEVRFNDKMWFGKYKGTRICDIISSNPAYILKILKENDIVLDKKSKTHFDMKMSGDRPKSLFGMPSASERAIRDSLVVENDGVLAEEPPDFVGEQIIHRTRAIADRHIAPTTKIVQRSMVSNVLNDDYFISLDRLIRIFFHENNIQGDAEVVSQIFKLRIMELNLIEDIHTKSDLIGIRTNGTIEKVFIRIFDRNNGGILLQHEVSINAMRLA